jgi:hypothetical protein
MSWPVINAAMLFRSLGIRITLDLCSRSLSRSNLAEPVHTRTCCLLWGDFSHRTARKLTSCMLKSGSWA